MNDNFWVDEEEGKEKDLKLGSQYPPVQVFLNLIEISKLNTAQAVIKSIILSDGKEVDLELILETDRDKFAKDLREVIDE